MEFSMLRCSIPSTCLILITVSSPAIVRRENPFSLLVALDENMSANGSLFLDDGESLNTYEKKQYTLINFTATQVSVSTSDTIHDRSFGQ